MLLSLGHQVRSQCMWSLEPALASGAVVDCMLDGADGAWSQRSEYMCVDTAGRTLAELLLLVLQEMAAAQRGWFMPASAAFAPLAARSGYRATELFEVSTGSGWCGCLHRPTAAPSRAERCTAPEALCAQSTACAVATVCVTANSYA